MSEKVSGKSANLKARPQLEKVLSCLGEGDELVFAEWDRATRSLQDGVQLMVRYEAGCAHRQNKHIPLRISDLPLNHVPAPYPAVLDIVEWGNESKLIAALDEKGVPIC